MPKSFEIEVTADANGIVVHLAGELDLAVRGDVGNRLAGVLTGVDAGQAGRVVIDLREVSFCDSSGLGALLDARQAAADAGVALVLRDVPPAVDRLLELTDVDGWLSRE
jgi:anti-sigma B factor antagonist